MRVTPLGSALFLVLALWSCAGGGAKNAVRPELLAAEEARLLAPFGQPRAVVSDVIRFDISANFYPEVSRPAISPELHKFSRSEEPDGDVYRWSSRGGLQSPLKFWVGQTQFVALRSATLRVRGSGPVVLQVTASGQVTESQRGAALQDWQELRIENGVFRRR